MFIKVVESWQVATDGVTSTVTVEGAKTVVKTTVVVGGAKTVVMITVVGTMVVVVVITTEWMNEVVSWGM